LRASGFKAFHDEAVAFAQESEAAGRAARARSSFDSYSFTIAFRGVLLEGVEVVFIVLTFGANQHRIPLAALAAAGAVALVVLVGVAVRKPLARVPENAMKFAVGVMLTSFGMFWSAEGAGASWPGSDAALLALIPGLLAAALAAVALMRRRVGSQSTATKPSAADGDDAADISVLLRIARGVWSFVVGDDWRIALGIVAVLAVVAVFAASEITAWWVLPLGVIVLLADSLRRAASPLARIR
jgi:hypothetical protein